MTRPEGQEQALIDEVIEAELEMFVAVQNMNGVAGCQQRPDSFRAMRWMTHSVFPEEYLESYLADLRNAKAKGINLMTVKYGRMDDLMPKFSDSPLVQNIADAECEWMQEMRDIAPENFRSTDNEGFRRYLASELETLSDRTLEIYQRVVDKARAEGRNLAQERYANLQKRLAEAG